MPRNQTSLVLPAMKALKVIIKELNTLKYVCKLTTKEVAAKRCKPTLTRVLLLQQRDDNDSPVINIESPSSSVVQLVLKIT